MRCLYNQLRHAGMVELADTQDLGSCASRRAGSTPVTRTIKEESHKGAAFLFLFADAFLSYTEPI